MRNNYVYALFENDKPIYIGRGVGDRCFWFRAKALQDDSYGIKSKLLSMRRKGILPTMRIILSGLTFDESCEWEKGLIALIGRRIRGEGPLWNLAAGGVNPGCIPPHVRKRMKNLVWRELYLRALRNGAKDPVWRATWQYRHGKKADSKTKPNLPVLRDKYARLGLAFPEGFFTG